MNQRKHLKIGIAAIGLLILTLALAGCGGANDPLAQPTMTIAAGTVTTTAGTTGATAVPVPAPVGVTMSIQPTTTLTDGSGIPVSGTIATSVSYSVVAKDLPSAASTMPAGTTLTAFVDISLGAVKNLSRPLTILINVTANGAKTGDALAVYSFNSTTNQWTFAGTEVVDANGNVAPTINHLSLWGVFKSTAALPPARPAGLTVTGGDGQVTATWTAPATGATAYNIYYSTLTGVTKTNGTKLTNAVSPQVITGLTNGTVYYFVVTALNATGESTESSEKSATPSATLQPPGSPTGVVLTSTAADAVTVTWNVVSGAASYNVYYSQSTPLTIGAGTNGTKVPSTTSPLSLTGLTSGATYYFLVTAVNAAGESGAQTNPKSITLSAAPQPPASPTGVSAVAGDSQVTVSWTASTGATSYNIYYATAAGVTKISGTKFTNAASPQVIATLANGTPYYFVVTAVNANGESVTSSERSATPAAAPQLPGSPNGVVVTSPAAGQANISWNAATGATSYNVYYGKTIPLTVGAGTNGTKATSANSPLNLTGLTSGATYYFLVTAVNAAGESGTQNNPKSVVVQ